MLVVVIYGRFKSLDKILGKGILINCCNFCIYREVLSFIGEIEGDVCKREEGIEFGKFFGNTLGDKGIKIYYFRVWW